MCGTTAAQLLTAALSRAVLLAHAALVSWRAVTVRHGDGALWVLLLLGAALLPLEMAFTTRLTQRGEWKWLSPMVLLYLASVVPSVWILELDLLEGRIAHLNLSASTTSSSSTSAPEQTTAPLSVSGVPFGGNNGGNGGGPDAATALSEAWVLALQQLMLVALVLARWLTPALGVSRAALSRLLLAQTGVAADVLDLLDAFKQPEVRADRAVRLAGLALFSWASLQFCVALMQAEEAATAGGGHGLRRWSRVGTGETRRHHRRHRHSSSSFVVIIVVIVVAVSHGHSEFHRHGRLSFCRLQVSHAPSASHLSSSTISTISTTTSTTTSSSFSSTSSSPFSLSKTTADDDDEAGAGAKRRTSSSARRRPCRCPMESLQLLSSVLMQDAPFLAFRLYLLAQVGVVNQTTVFFTCKNALTLLVELYGAATAAAATTA
ncbi:unnamed protein product [Lampetra fluviatilis]